MGEHWSEVGRRLTAQSDDVNKVGRMDLIRQEAQKLELSPHSVGRFIVLSKLLQDLNVAPEQTEFFAIGVTEVLARIADRDIPSALKLTDRIIRGRVLYREAIEFLKEVDKNNDKHFTKKEANKSDDVLFALNKALINKGMNVNIISTSPKLPELSKNNSSWTTSQDDIIAYISEIDFLYASDRGARNFARNCIIATSEYDLVVVDFVSHRSEREVMFLINEIRNDIRERIISIGVINSGIKSA